VLKCNNYFRLFSLRHGLTGCIHESCFYPVETGNRVISGLHLASLEGKLPSIRSSIPMDISISFFQFFAASEKTLQQPKQKPKKFTPEVLSKGLLWKRRGSDDVMLLSADKEIISAISSVFK
jgi:hypothetical protein